MTTQEFFLQQYDIDLFNTGSRRVNDIINECLLHGIDCPKRKEISLLSDDELFCLFMWRYRCSKHKDPHRPICKNKVIIWAKQEIAKENINNKSIEVVPDTTEGKVI